MPPRAAKGVHRLPPKKPPEKQSTAVLVTCYIGLPVALIAFLAGVGGVMVLLDEPDRTKWYSQTQFADLWRWAVQKNPFYATICVNGGMVMMLFLGTRLVEHYRWKAHERSMQRRVKARKAE